MVASAQLCFLGENTSIKQQLSFFLLLRGVKRMMLRWMHRVVHHGQKIVRAPFSHFFHLSGFSDRNAKKNCPANHGLDYVNPIAEGVSIGRSLNRLPTRVLVAHLSRVPPEFFQDKTKTTERVTFFPFSECMSLACLSAADKEQLQVCERESPCVK